MVLGRMLSFALIPLWALACDSPTVVSGPLAAKTTRTELLLHNRGAEPVYYFAVGRNLAARINWATCRDPVTRPAVNPSEVERIPLRQIAFDERGEDELLVYCWHLVPAGEGVFEPHYIPGLLVPL